MHKNAPPTFTGGSRGFPDAWTEFSNALSLGTSGFLGSVPGKGLKVINYMTLLEI